MKKLTLVSLLLAIVWLLVFGSVSVFASTASTVGTRSTASPNAIGLSIWQLQLPDNTSVGPPATSTSPWFVKNSDGSWTFDDPGTYVLRCRADDGALVADEDVTIVVKP